MTNSMQPKTATFDNGNINLITAPNGWHFFNLCELWHYRELLGVLTMRDIKVRYKQTVLGAIWAVLQPLITMLIFTVVFGRLAKIPSEGFPYPVFVYAALLPWTFFANAVSISGNSMVASAQLVSKVYFPRLIIPLSSIGAGLIDLLISTIILLLLMIYFNIAWTMNILMAPFLVIGVIFCALSVGTVLSALTVTYRDFRFVIPFMVQIWMYVTPVVYGLSFIPEKWRWLLLLNPMTGYIDGFRSAFLGQPFNWHAIGISILITLILFIMGITYFQKVERRFADVI